MEDYRNVYNDKCLPAFMRLQRCVLVMCHVSHFILYRPSNICILTNRLPQRNAEKNSHGLKQCICPHSREWQGSTRQNDYGVMSCISRGTLSSSKSHYSFNSLNVKVAPLISCSSSMIRLFCSSSFASATISVTCACSNGLRRALTTASC